MPDVPRLRALVALCAALSLLAPAAVAAGVGAHLQWAEHHGGHAGHAHHAHGHGEPHQHPPAGEHEREGGTTAGAALGASGSHSHEAPEPAVAPAAFRQAQTRALLPEPGDDGPAVACPAGDPGSSAAGEAPGRPPDRGTGPPSTPPLIHLHCALLL